MDHWLEFGAQRLCGQPALTGALAELDKALSLRTFLVGHALTLADICVWASLKGAALIRAGSPHRPSSRSTSFCPCSAPGHAEWPSQGRSFSHVNRWFSFLNSRVPFSAVGNKYTGNSPTLTKSNVSVVPAAGLCRDPEADMFLIFPVVLLSFNSLMRRNTMLASLWICRVLRWARWWLDSPLKPVGKVWLPVSAVIIPKITVEHYHIFWTTSPSRVQVRNEKPHEGEMKNVFRLPGHTVWCRC